MRGRVLALASAAYAASCTTDEVRIAHAPSAFAGWDRTALVGATIALDGSQSRDLDGLALAYAWRLEAAPSGSSAEIDSPASRVAGFVPDRAGSYIASLTVSNGALASRDLVAIQAMTSTAAEPPADLRLALDPPLCNVALDHADMRSCAGSGGPSAIEIAPILLGLSAEDAGDARVLWTLFRAPPGEDASSTGATFTGAPAAVMPLRFVPARPGEYWISATLIIRDRVYPPAFTSIGVFAGDAPIASRPIARIDAKASVQRGERVLLDGQHSRVPPPPAPREARYTWTLADDPSNGTDALVDAATGCPTDQCRVLFPTASGTYVIALHVASGDLEGTSAVVALEVK
jgi:hypothetical protein